MEQGVSRWRPNGSGRVAGSLCGGWHPGPAACAVGGDAARFLWHTGAPAAGQISVDVQGNVRTFSVNEVDADGFTRRLSVILPGDNFTLTDDPATPPVTSFARYVITSPPVDAGGGVWTFTALRTDQAGSPAPPADGTSVVAYLSSATLKPAGVTTYSGPTEPTDPDVGDVWVVTP